MSRMGLMGSVPLDACLSPCASWASWCDLTGDETACFERTATGADS